MLKYLVIVSLGALVTGLPQRPIILTEQRPVPSNYDYRQGPPAANTRSQTPPLRNNAQFLSLTPVPTSNPKITLYNPNGQNLTFVITAKDLPNTDLLDNIDPYIKVYSANKTHPEPEKFGTTDIIKDSPNAEFLNVFSSVWKKGQGQKWVLKVKDSDTLRDKSIGEAIIDVDDYVLKGEKLTATLKDAEGKPVNGTLLVQKTEPIKFKLYARNLPRADPFNGKSDPFVKCYWKREKTGEAIKFFETKVHNDLENVDWDDEIIELANYIKGTNLWFVFKVYDSDSTGEDELGEAQVLIDPYVEKRQTLIVDLIRNGKKGQATLGITPVSA